MIHHDNRDYTQAMKDAQVHLEETIHKKVASAGRVIQTVQSQIPVDRMVGTKGLRFSHTTEMVKSKDDKGKDIQVPKHQIIMGTKRGSKGFFEEPLHKHALNQAAGRAFIPETFVNRMLEKPYGGELIVENLNTIFAKEAADRYLVRSVNEEVRGVLSDTYRRMDSRPIIEAFALAAKEAGAVPVEGIGGELRFALKVLQPRVYTIGHKKGMEEIVTFGAQLANSDFGCGALSLSFFLLRVWCTNTATREDALRKVHLGKRLGDDIVYSNETYEADTKAMTLAVRDHVAGLLAAPRVAESLAIIEKAMDETIEPKKFFERDGELSKLKLSKSEIERAREAFNNGGVEQLPPGNTLYRMSNALSWIAQTAETAERRLELERTAGALLDKAA